MSDAMTSHKNSKKFKFPYVFFILVDLDVTTSYTMLNFLYDVVIFDHVFTNFLMFFLPLLTSRSPDAASDVLHDFDDLSHDVT